MELNPIIPNIYIYRYTRIYSIYIYINLIESPRSYWYRPAVAISPWLIKSGLLGSQRTHAMQFHIAQPRIKDTVQHLELCLGQGMMWKPILVVPARLNWWLLWCDGGWWKKWKKDHGSDLKMVTTIEVWQNLMGTILIIKTRVISDLSKWSWNMGN